SALRKIALPLEQRRHPSQRCGTRALPVTLPTEQEKRAVAAIVDFGYPYRTGEHAAELVATQFGLALIEETAGIEQVVAQKLEQRAVWNIRAALQNHVHDAAGQPSVFGGEAAGLHLEFLQRVDVRPRLRSRSPRVL